MATYWKKGAFAVRDLYTFSFDDDNFTMKYEPIKKGLVITRNSMAVAVIRVEGMVCKIDVVSSKKDFFECIINETDYENFNEACNYATKYVKLACLGEDYE